MKQPLLPVVLLLQLWQHTGAASSASSLRPALPARQTSTQRALVARLTAAARVASSAASPMLMAALDDPEVRRMLHQRGLPQLAAAPPAMLLEQLRAEAAVAEITHNLALGNGTVRHGKCVACDGWAPGADSGMIRTPLFTMDTLPSLWTLGLLGYADPGEVSVWMRGADAVECGVLGCPAFEGSLSQTQRVGRPPYWPANKSEALNRPIYAVLDLNKIDVGVPDFGPVAIVMNRSTIAPLTALMPVDMGLWAPACRFDVRFHDTEQCARQHTPQECERPCGGDASRCDISCSWQQYCSDRVRATTGCCVANRAVDNCCSAQTQWNGLAPRGCVACGVTKSVDGGARSSAECCQQGFGAQINCSAWDRTPGIAGHIDHTLLAAAQTQNDTGMNVSRNLAIMLSRSAAPYGSVPRFLPHSNYYIEANILGTPQFHGDAQDVLFVIAAFPFLFGEPLGQELRNWTTAHKLPLVWALGPEGCYEGINQTGDVCQTSIKHHTPGYNGPPGAGAWGPTSQFIQRLLDPVASRGLTDLTITLHASSETTLEKAWTQAVRDKAGARAQWNASRAWSELTAGLPAPLRLAPISAGRCDSDTTGSTIGYSVVDGRCVRALRQRSY